ncbi:MAG: sigma-70 family RNA polymerase sigma factor [Candidatus Pacearchaeota archaeon]|jgi:RNA polymerase sigma factor (sigma-70 family)
MHNLVFEQYTKTLAHQKYTPLKAAEERELMFQVASGSAEAFERVVNSHLRFVIYFLRNFTIPNNVDVMDVIQEANVGLIQGIRRYDVSKYKVRVFSYCFYHIRFAIGQYLKEIAEIRENVINSAFEGDFQDVEDLNNDTSFIRNTSEDIVKLYLSDISEKERIIISLLFGLDPPYEARTLRDVATIMHTTSECVRLQKEKILDKIKIHKDDF